MRCFILSVLAIVLLSAPVAHALDAGLLPQSFIANSILTLPKVRGIAEVYNQKIAYMLPRGFIPGKDFDDGQAYSVELLPSDYQATDWKARLVITGYRDAADIENVTANTFAKNILKPGENCKAFWLARDLGARSVDGYDAHAVMTGCGSMRMGEYAGAIAGAGEVHVVLIVQGLHDMFTVDVILRGKGFAAGALPLPVETAQRLVNYFYPVALCAASVTTTQCAAQQKQAAQGLK